MKVMSMVATVMVMAVLATGVLAAGELPQGHPDISKALPPGMQLPAGHPDISSTTKPAIIGALSIHAVQGTKDGPQPAGDQVFVELYNNDQVIQKLVTKLDEKGMASVSDLPVRLPFQPLVTVIHDGVEYQAVGEPMDAMHAQEQVEVKVYEATDQEPGWQVRMRHVMVAPMEPDGASEGAIQVMDMLAVENPTDRAWTGKGDAAQGKTTFVLELPAGAKDIQPTGGFHDCCTRIEGNKVINTMAILPGMAQCQVMYRVPAKEGVAELTVKAPAPVKHLMVFVPDDGRKVEAVGLEDGGTAKLQNGKTRFYKAQDLAAGQEVKLTVGGLKAAATSAPSPAAAGSAQAAKIVAGAGAIMILVFGGAFMFMKAPKRK